MLGNVCGSHVKVGRRREPVKLPELQASKTRLHLVKFVGRDTIRWQWGESRISPAKFQDKSPCNSGLEWA